MRLPVSPFLPVAACILLLGCGGTGKSGTAIAPPLDPVGPSADYPVVIGEPFEIDGVTHRPVDTMNYDAVGYAAMSPEGGTAVSIAHKTLPLPSYAEVTALDTGRTILVRVERRGPMTNERLVELSPAAAAQLGVADLAPVRVRRVNPPEAERALLRAGQQAPQRMDTPKALLAVLSRKLDPLPNALSRDAPQISESIPSTAALDEPAIAPETEASHAPVSAAAAKAEQPSVAEVPARTQSTARSLWVQAAAFSTEERARAAAAKLGVGTDAAVTRGGKFWNMRIGPFATRAEAEAALASVRKAGYSDARILRVD